MEEPQAVDDTSVVDPNIGEIIAALLEIVHASAHIAPELSEVTQDGQRLLAELSESLGLLSGKAPRNRQHS